MVLLDDDKTRLAEWREAIRERLEQERLRLHPRKAHIYQTRRGVKLLGYLVFPDFRLLVNANGYRFRRRLRGFAKGYATGRLSWKDFDPSVRAWVGHACHADTWGLRKRVLGGVSFVRGSGPISLPAPGLGSPAGYVSQEQPCPKTITRA